MALAKKKVKPKGKQKGGQGNARANVKTTGTRPIAGLSAEQMSGGITPDIAPMPPTEGTFGSDQGAGLSGAAKQTKPKGGNKY